MDWTIEAKKYLHDHISKLTAEPATGDEYQDLYTDLKAHVEEENHSAGRELIEVNDLDRVLKKMGGDEFAVNSDSMMNAKDASLSVGGAADRKVSSESLDGRSLSRRHHFFSISAWFFTIILPALALIVELIFNQSQMSFFDPIPSWVHVVFIALIPITFYLVRHLNGFSHLYLDGDARRLRRPRVTAALMGFIFPTIIYYVLLFLPLMHIAFIGCIVLLGLLMFAPLFSLIGWFSASIGLMETLENTRNMVAKKWFKYGLLMGLVGLTCLELPSYLNQVAVRKAVSGDVVEEERGVEFMRNYGGAELLLQRCYFGNQRAVGGRNLRIGGSPSDWVWNMMSPVEVNPEQARELYYRVTGVPFNSAKPEPNRRDSGLLLGEMTWDADHGGDAVAGRVRGLEMYSSRMDMHIDDASRMGYVEWIIEFKNNNDVAKEARMQVTLPHQGFVSKLTLWVNGEERPAAYSTVGKVKAAYKKIAVVQRRDPVLVNVSGADRVMLQCFPVPADGGLMKVKVGVTFPIDAVRDAGNVHFPYIAERNFNVPKGLLHEIYAQSDLQINTQDSSRQEVSKTDTLQFSLNNSQLKTERITWRDLTHSSDTTVWSEDVFHKEDDKFLIREEEPYSESVDRELIIVIDSSSSMVKWKPMLSKLLESKHPRVKVYCARSAKDPLRECVSRADLENTRFTGGVDNVPGLRSAISLARKTKGQDVAILWLHGPQPVRFSTLAGLEQDLERSTKSVPIYSVSLEDGENHVLKALKNCSDFCGGCRVVNETDLIHMVEKVVNGSTKIRYTWRRTAIAPEQGARVWDQLVRSWAYATTVDGWRGRKETSRLAQRAARYQIVTPVTGAVVLESAGQYRETGLEVPGTENASSIPAVPEPSSSLLLLLGGLVAMLRRRRSLAE